MSLFISGIVGKANRTKRITGMVTENVYDRLMRLAKWNGWTQSKMVNLAVLVGVSALEVDYARAMLVEVEEAAEQAQDKIEELGYTADQIEAARGLVEAYERLMAGDTPS
jgi:hypothetical protein